MLLTLGTILIASLPYYARLVIVVLLGALTISAVFIPDFFVRSDIAISLTTALLVYFSMSSSEAHQTSNK
ncbi:hypothetical protein [Marinomonas sp. GJ51-6]|uniref:hypothetical protein n=1 Tax=Marinomonas sp. GJ51-6 TaxID=2992802 RepID=UPI002934C8FD|nr:hypothetical protein [Marinomonas sp. GJ51-6]WOD06912.1 hypothetical protein ONZ50_14880 [Marinomonas sp. GJ51-6]